MPVRRTTRLTVIGETPARFATASRVGVLRAGSSVGISAMPLRIPLPCTQDIAFCLMTALSFHSDSAIIRESSCETVAWRKPMLSEQQVQAYKRDGVIVVPDVLDSQMLARMRHVVAELVAGAASTTEHT